MKFGQLIDNNMKHGNIFLEKLYIKYDGKNIPRPFLKKSKLNIPNFNSLKFYIVSFYCMLRAIKIY